MPADGAARTPEPRAGEASARGGFARLEPVARLDDGVDARAQVGLVGIDGIGFDAGQFVDIRGHGRIRGKVQVGFVHLLEQLQGPAQVCQ